MFATWTFVTRSAWGRQNWVTGEIGSACLGCLGLLWRTMTSMQQQKVLGIQESRGNGLEGPRSFTFSSKDCTLKAGQFCNTTPEFTFPGGAHAQCPPAVVAQGILRVRATAILGGTHELSRSKVASEDAGVGMEHNPCPIWASRHTQSLPKEFLFAPPPFAPSEAQ